MIIAVVIGAGDLATPNNQWIRITSRQRIGLAPSYGTQDYEKTTADGKHYSFSYNLCVHISDWNYPDWWNTFRLMAFKECLYFTTVCNQGPH